MEDEGVRVSRHAKDVGSVSSSPRVVVIVLNWNGRGDTLECLRSLSGVEYRNFEVIVADNGSSDGSEQAVREEFPWVRVLQNGRNLGFAEGNNRAIVVALDSDADFILVLNNDTVVDPQILTSLTEAASQAPQGGIFGPKIYCYGDKDRLWYAGGYWNRRSLTFEERGAGERDVGQFNALAETDWVVGCAMFVRACVFRTIGLLEPKFFLNNEEIDFCSRARRAGFRCVFVPQARIWHKISASFGGEHSPMKEYFSSRNRLLWASRNAGLALRLRIYADTLKKLGQRFVLPLGRAAYRQPLSLKCLWWSVRQACLDPQNRAYFLGVRDFFLRRLGNCPDRVRALNNQWSVRRGEQLRNAPRATSLPDLKLED